MVTTRVQGLLKIEPDYELDIKERLPTNGIVEALSNRHFDVLVTNIIKSPLKVDRTQVLGRLTDQIEKVVATDLQKSENGLPPKSFINIVVSKYSSTKKVVDLKTSDCRDSMFIPNKQATCSNKFTAMLETFGSMCDENLRGISTVKQRVNLESSDVCPKHSVPYRAGPKARYFERLKIHNVLAMNFNEPIKK